MIQIHEFSRRILDFYRSLKKLKGMLQVLKSSSNDIETNRDNLREVIAAEKVLNHSKLLYFSGLRQNLVFTGAYDGIESIDAYILREHSNTEKEIEQT